MEEIIEILNKNEWYKWDANNDSFERTTGLYNFPNDYLTFMKWSNGGEGKIGKNYLYLWKMEDIEQYNKDYQIQMYLGENCTGFGMDGDICYCFDSKNGNKIIKSELGDLDYKEIEIIANTFYEFITKMDKECI